MDLLFIDDEDDWLEEMSDLVGSLPDVAAIWTLSHLGVLEEFLQTHTPDIICLALKMHPLNGLQVAKMLSWRQPSPILLISAHLAEYALQDLMATGIRGMLSKNKLGKQLHTALQALHNGQTWFPYTTTRQQQAHEAEQYDALHGCWAQLTPRQKDICMLFGQGLAPKEIAASLQISVETVKSHLSQARQVFGASQSYALLACLSQLKIAQHLDNLKNAEKRLRQQNAYRPTGYKW